MKWKSLLIGLIISVSLSGCYTQLATGDDYAEYKENVDKTRIEIPDSSGEQYEDEYAYSDTSEYAYEEDEEQESEDRDYNIYIDEYNNYDFYPSHRRFYFGYYPRFGSYFSIGIYDPWYWDYYVYDPWYWDPFYPSYISYNFYYPWASIYNPYWRPYVFYGFGKTKYRTNYFTSLRNTGGRGYTRSRTRHGLMDLGRVSRSSTYKRGTVNQRVDLNKGKVARSKAREEIRKVKSLRNSGRSYTHERKITKSKKQEIKSNRTKARKSVRSSKSYSKYRKSKGEAKKSYRKKSTGRKKVYKKKTRYKVDNKSFRSPKRIYRPKSKSGRTKKYSAPRKSSRSKSYTPRSKSSRSKSYSRPKSNRSSSRSYSRPSRSSSRSYSSPSRSYSRSYSSPSRSSSSGRSSGSRSSSGRSRRR